MLMKLLELLATQFPQQERNTACSPYRTLFQETTSSYGVCFVVPHTSHSVGFHLIHFLCITKNSSVSRSFRSIGCPGFSIPALCTLLIRTTACCMPEPSMGNCAPLLDTTLGPPRYRTNSQVTFSPIFLFATREANEVYMPSAQVFFSVERSPAANAVYISL
jgi:hypothetical protein